MRDQYRVKFMWFPLSFPGTHNRQKLPIHALSGNIGHFSGPQYRYRKHLPPHSVSTSHDMPFRTPLIQPHPAGGLPARQARCKTERRSAAKSKVFSRQPQS
jgi:hypothetical protein